MITTSSVKCSAKRICHSVRLSGVGSGVGGTVSAGGCSPGAVETEASVPAGVWVSGTETATSGTAGVSGVSAAGCAGTGEGETALSSGAIDGYISERPGAVSACAANADLTFVTPGFVASEEDTSVAVAIKKGQPELIEQINGILAGIDADARNQLMDDAVLNQPVSAE